MKIALAQINPIVGDIAGNTELIVDLIGAAREEAVDLVVFPELAITGYPPEDLLFKDKFISDNLFALHEIAAASDNIAVFVGFVDRGKSSLYNAAAFIVDKKIKATYHKINLPNYSVFDEKRYFAPGKKPMVVNLKGKKIGLGICEDLWVEKGPYLAEAKEKAEIILSINASPYHMGKISEREALIRKRAKQTKATIVYVNQVGGQDELVFDGGSMAIDGFGTVVAAAQQFEQELTIFEIDGDGFRPERLSAEEEVYEALKLGVADYVYKNSFKEVVIGLSGGIDSALTLTIAVDALGKENVHAVFMPSEFSSKLSRQDAEKLAKDLGVGYAELPIDPLNKLYLGTLKEAFKDKAPNIAEENLQARIRGTLLMALSNKHNYLVLTTGNKSETSTGYCTLYGDMAGGYNVLKDVPKTLVYKLAKWRNLHKEVIPNTTIDRAPTAELKANQKDQDSLPPYDVLDAIMAAYVEKDLSVDSIVALGFDEKTVQKVVSLIDRAEYKRRQAPPGPRITSRAFGKDWRLPITNGFKG